MCCRLSTCRASCRVPLVLWLTDTSRHLLFEAAVACRFCLQPPSSPIVTACLLSSPLVFRLIDVYPLPSNYLSSLLSYYLSFFSSPLHCLIERGGPMTVTFAKLLSFESLTILIDSVEITQPHLIFPFFFFLLVCLHTYMQFCNYKTLATLLLGLHTCYFVSG
jgi:hypothetical protein